MSNDHLSRERKREHGAPFRCILATDRSAVGFDEALADAQAESETGFLAADKWLEQALANARRDAGTSVMNLDLNDLVSVCRRSRARSARGMAKEAQVHGAAAGQRVQRVEQQVDDDLVNLL